MYKREALIKVNLIRVSYKISIKDFEGPLDLLLFFIRRDELDIFDIPVARIADEYLEHVRLLEQIDLDSAGEFLYMAAVLIGIKARMLLPGQEVDEDGEPVDPRRELVERLLEYVRYKEASGHLLALERERAERFTRNHAVSERAVWEEKPDLNASVFDLVSALKRILAEAPEDPLHDITREEYSIEEQRAFILDRLAAVDSLSFSVLVENRSRPFIVATFLAALELVHAQQVHVHIAEGDPIDFYLALRIRQDETDFEDPDRADDRIEGASGERNGNDQ